MKSVLGKQKTATGKSSSGELGAGGGFVACCDVSQIAERPKSECFFGSRGRKNSDLLSRRGYVLFHTQWRRGAQNGSSALEFLSRTMHNQHELTRGDFGFIFDGAVFRDS